ncbi:MAG: VCBS repeat-containing protein [Gemmatimonadaceae bacterium]
MIAPQRLFRPATALVVQWSLVLGLASCSEPAESANVARRDALPKPGSQLFTRLPSSATGIRFENRLEPTADFNVFTYRNFYNGGGVAIGDLTGDGLPEIVLTSNLDGPRVYLNEGQFAFRDVTGRSGLKHEKGSWTTGVALADVNGDGRLDIYISKAGKGEPATRANELWINRGVEGGVPTFENMAQQYGVADEGMTTQAAFLDYDGDGDLDLFVMNNSLRSANTFGLHNSRDQQSKYGDRLYRNDGEHFTDVSIPAGIHGPEMAFGLGVVVADVNNDGRPDIYVANDFFERDYLYVNRGDGTFSEALDRQMPVISYSSMGMDAADVDNDGWPDVYTTDMLPDDERRLKTTTQFEGWDQYQAKVSNGYHHQAMRNMLQRNNRDGTFSDVGQMAGVSRTDWSWSALIADLDLDGEKDIVVTNGIAKDLTSQDYVALLGNAQTMRDATKDGRSRVDFKKLIDMMTATPLPNYAFHNVGGMRFVNEATGWGLDTPSFSSGAAYGDLDGDGASDLVVNNIDQEAFVYRNNARALHPQHHYLRVRLVGEGKNRFGLGARVTAYAGGALFMQEQSPVRGFQSSVDYVLDFGLGARTSVDSLRVVWPDGRVSVQRGVSTNQLVTVTQTSAGARPVPPVLPPAMPLMTDVTTSAALDFVHHENAFVDFNRELLIPKLLSTEGPMVAVGDVNGDGLDDVYIGGAKEQPGRLELQRRDGTFAPIDDDVFAPDAISEDVGAVFFDANGDGRPDLYVVSGGSEYSDGAPALQDRLYLNNGRGHLRRATDALPPEFASGSRVVAADYDGDGTIDLFVGGRVEPWRYGLSPQSLLLRNDGRGHFTNVTAQRAPELERIGMVTDACWRDVDGDGRLDLIVVGEWMPITVFRNEGGGRLKRLVVPGLEKSDGWWNRIVAGDFTGDGRVDFIVGNLGENGALHASASEPTTMVVKDFDANGSFEQILSAVNHGQRYPLALRDDLLRALPMLSTRLPTYASYAGKTVEQVFTPAELADAMVRQAYTFATTLVRNDGGGRFTLVPLPDEAQLAPVYAILPTDVDGDGRADLLLAGNFDGFRPEIGRMAASYGLLLRGDGKGAFTPSRAPESGFVVPGQARDIARLRTATGEAYIVTRNNDRPLFFRSFRSRRSLAVRSERGASERSSR